MKIRNYELVYYGAISVITALTVVHYYNMPLTEIAHGIGLRKFTAGGLLGTLNIAELLSMLEELNDE